MKTAIDFKNLTLGYDQQPAVSQLETNIKEGSLTAIVGPNGAGKSTLLSWRYGSTRTARGTNNARLKG